MENDEIHKMQREIYRFSQKQSPPYHGLTPWLREKKLLEYSWKKTSICDGANTPGIDGETCNGIASRIGPWLNTLHGELLQGTYTPQKAKLVDIPKKSGDFRTIGILTIKDRVVQMALKLLLEPIFEDVFHPNSFGFRPGRSVAAALQHACDDIVQEDHQEYAIPYAVHLDVADCFGTIDHHTLVEDLREIIVDDEILLLIQKILSCNARQTGLWSRRKIGLVQGGSFSPLLCNLVLHKLDTEMDNFSRIHHGNVNAFRYADDILLIGRTTQIVESGIQKIKQILKRQHQKIGTYDHVDLIWKGCSWLGVEFQTYRNPWTQNVYVKYSIPHDKVKNMLSRIDEMTMPPSDRIEGNTFNLARWVASINSQLRDWYNVIVYAENAMELFATLDEHSFERVGYLLKSILKIRNNKLQKLYRKKLPRGFQTWNVNGCELIVLSSLPPKRPGNLVHQPPWKNNKPTMKSVFSSNPTITLGRNIQ